MWSPHSYRKKAEEKCLSQDTITSSVETIKRISDRDSPAVILTLNHLAKRTKVNYKYLKSVIERRNKIFYQTFHIKKRSGGVREIHIPSYNLARTQKWINKFVLSKAKVHNASFAFSPGSSILECAARHCSARWLIKLDIKDFFESISEIQVYRTFQEIGYTPLISFELARITTVVSRSITSKVWKIRNKNDKIPNYTYYNNNILGNLPQGAPTSPMLSNLVMNDMDEQISHLASSFNAEYTRYSDDMTFSTSDLGFNRKEAKKLICSVREILSPNGLQLQDKKTMVVPPGARKIVLGLNVNEEKPKLRKEFKDNIRLHLHYLTLNGPIDHMKIRKFRSINSMRKHIRGLIDYSNLIEPDYAKKVLEKFNAIEWPI